MWHVICNVWRVTWNIQTPHHWRWQSEAIFYRLDDVTVRPVPIWPLPVRHDLPRDNPVTPDIRSRCKLPVRNCFRGCPADGYFSSLCEGWVSGWMDGWWMNGWMGGGWIGGWWMDGWWMDGWVDGWWMNGWMDGSVGTENLAINRLVRIMERRIDPLERDWWITRRRDETH